MTTASRWAETAAAGVATGRGAGDADVKADSGGAGWLSDRTAKVPFGIAAGPVAETVSSAGGPEAAASIAALP